MIIRENVIEVEKGDLSAWLQFEGEAIKAEELIFFDLEHYVYKKPKCVGVFGACVYDKDSESLQVTQYMIENKNEVIDILVLAKKYFMKMKELGRKKIVTFSGNNDFTVINYLFNKFNLQYGILTEFEELDIQKLYEKNKGTSIGLKNLEKEFGINRQSELISGSNLAKTFHKILKDKEYIQRMPKEKINIILLYNQQDVVSLYKILSLWNEYINVKEEELEEESESQETIEELLEGAEVEEDIVEIEEKSEEVI